MEITCKTILVAVSSVSMFRSRSELRPFSNQGIQRTTFHLLRDCGVCLCCEGRRRTMVYRGVLFLFPANYLKRRGGRPMW